MRFTRASGGEGGLPEPMGEDEVYKSQWGRMRFTRAIGGEGGLSEPMREEEVYKDAGNSVTS